MRAVSTPDDRTAFRVRSMNQTDAQVADLQRELARHQSRIRDLEAARADLEHQLAERDVRLRELETALASARTAALRLEAELLDARARAGTAEADDLKVLRGIGPSVERTLHLLGIRRYEQIAAWNHQDIWEVAQKLRTAPERILRYDWIGGAREELSRKLS